MPSPAFEREAIDQFCAGVRARTGADVHVADHPERRP